MLLSKQRGEFEGGESFFFVFAYPVLEIDGLAMALALALALTNNSGQNAGEEQLGK